MTLTSELDFHSSLEQKKLLHRITDRIRRLLELEDILATTVNELRAFVNTDRVMVYKFHSDNSGQVIAEAINENKLPSLFGLNFPADDIPQHARELFVKSRVRSIVNVETRQIGQSRFNSENTVDNFNYRPVDPCHIEYLTAMGVKSSFVLPIMYHDELWGLLVSHHCESRQILNHEIEAMQMVVDLVSIAVAQSTVLVQAREKAHHEAVVNHITNQLHSSNIELQAALENAVAAFIGSGGRLCVCSETSDSSLRFSECLDKNENIELYLCGKQPIISGIAKYPLMEQYSVWQEHYKSSEYKVWAISDIYQTPGLRSLQVAFRPTTIRSILMVPLCYRQELLGYLSIFRDIENTETLWAGQFDTDERQLYPRQSFEVWRQLKQAQVHEWTAQEIDLAQNLGHQFAIAIYEYKLYKQVQALNCNLENQVIQRTYLLQKATEQQRLLFEFVAKMRDSLDIETIFNTTTKELRRVFGADRVGIYQFEPDSEYNYGEFVTEDIAPGIPSALAIKVHDHCFGEYYATKYKQGRVNCIPDIYKAEIKECFLNVLNQFQIQATLVAPVMKGDELWGLLCVHQCIAPREWQNSEIQFVTQVATQLSVALEQAELLTQTRQQTEQITQALQTLQQTQTQLIQTEKMSSLGQLVAGIAHEINNPVNFIYGNINHISQYSEDLLGMLDLYQQHYLELRPEIIERAEEIDLDFIVEDLPKMLSSIKVGTDRIRQIVLSLRNFSRLDQADIKPVNVHDGIDSTLVILQHRLKAKPENPAIQIIKQYGDLPPVECYAGQLNQVFMNILSNAIDALEERRESSSESNPSQITIKTSLSKLSNDIPCITISIADNGSGMPENVIKKIFDPFFTTKDVGKGTGLGLSISYQIIVEKHNGSLKCNSQIGRGTEFLIEIPIS